MNKEEQSKNIILEQGFDQFAKIGVKKFTVESLASDLGMSKKTIYKFFPTKIFLIEKIFEYFTGSVKRKFQSIVESNDSPIIKFTNAMNFIINKIGYLKMENAMEVKVRYPKLWEQIERFRLDLLQYFTIIFKEAQSQGYAKPNLNMDTVALIYMNIINSTFQPEFFLQNNLAPGDTIRSFVTMITEGIFTSQGIAEIDKND